MPIMPPDAPTAAALSAVVGDVPGLEMCHGQVGKGVEWIRVAWRGKEIIMERLADDVAWSAFDPAHDDAIGTGEAPEEALRAALAHY